MTHPPFSFSCFVTTRGCGKGSERDTVGGCKASKHSALAQCIREISALNLELGPELPMASENETGGGRRALPFFFLSFFGLSFIWRGLVSWWVRFAQSADTCCLLPAACLPARLPADECRFGFAEGKREGSEGERERERERDDGLNRLVGLPPLSSTHQPNPTCFFLLPFRRVASLRQQAASSLKFRRAGLSCMIQHIAAYCSIAWHGIALQQGGSQDSN